MRARIEVAEDSVYLVLSNEDGGTQVKLFLSAANARKFAARLLFAASIADDFSAAAGQNKGEN